MPKSNVRANFGKVVVEGRDIDDTLLRKRTSAKAELDGFGLSWGRARSSEERKECKSCRKSKLHIAGR